MFSTLVAGAAPSPRPRATAFIIGSCTSACARLSALNPPGCASTLANARSVSRICSRMSSGFRATSNVWRSVSGSLSAAPSSGLRSRISRVRGSASIIARNISGLRDTWSSAARIAGEFITSRIAWGLLCISRCI